MLNTPLPTQRMTTMTNQTIAEESTVDDLIDALASASCVDHQSQTIIHARENPKPHVHSRPWILCIDDDQSLTEALQIRLRHRGFDVARAGCGRAGFRYAFEFEPVAILLDLNMPYLPGEEVLTRLKANPATRTIPVIIMTGHDQPGLKERLLSVGASDYFRKPVPHNLLVEVVSYYAGLEPQN